MSQQIGQTPGVLIPPRRQGGFSGCRSSELAAGGPPVLLPHFVRPQGVPPTRHSSRANKKFGLDWERGLGEHEGWRPGMSRYEIPFLTACIQAFGERFAMSRQAAFRYLRDHKGLAFLIEFYDVEHLQSLEETLDDLLVVCRRNGGKLA